MDWKRALTGLIRTDTPYADGVMAGDAREARERLTNAAQSLLDSKGQYEALEQHELDKVINALGRLFRAAPARDPRGWWRRLTSPLDVTQLVEHIQFSLRFIRRSKDTARYIGSMTMRIWSQDNRPPS